MMAPELREHQGAVFDHRGLAEWMDSLKRLRRAEGVGIPHVLYNLVGLAQLFHQPDDPGRARVVEMMDLDHGFLP